MSKHIKPKLVFCLLSAILCASLASCETPAPERNSEVECQVDEQVFLLEWPVLPLTDEQVTSVAECDFERLASSRYPDTLGMDELASTYAPESACDWAVLALAYAERTEHEESLPESAKEAFGEAVTQNAGYALATPIFYEYFGSISLVEPPPFADQSITRAEIFYDWGGLGQKVSYSIKITQADADPKVSVKPRRLATSRPEIDSCLVQALAPALSDWLPVDSQFTLLPCTDNYPDWSVSLTFADGTTLDVTSNSNFMGAGGPWQTSIDGQDYVQYSPAFAKALLDLIQALELPLGQPAGMTCSGEEVFDKAFSRE